MDSATTSWGRFGEEDERGALNLITPEGVLRATQLVRRGLVISLGLQVRRSGPFAGEEHRNRPLHLMRTDGADSTVTSNSGLGVADDYVFMPTHGGTHVDALCHVWHDNTMYNGFPSALVRSTGARRLGAEKLGPIVSRGLLADVAALHGRAHLEPGFVIEREHVHESLGPVADSVQPGDVLLVRTGWLEAYDELGPERFTGARPGIGEELAEWIVEKGVALVGADTSSVEVVPSESGDPMPIHVKLLRDHGVPLMELVDLSELGRTGAREFLFVAHPLPVLGGTAGPVAPMAIL